MIMLIIDHHNTILPPFVCAFLKQSGKSSLVPVISREPVDGFSKGDGNLQKNPPKSLVLPEF